MSMKNSRNFSFGTVEFKVEMYWVRRMFDMIISGNSFCIKIMFIRILIVRPLPSMNGWIFTNL